MKSTSAAQRVQITRFIQDILESFQLQPHVEVDSFTRQGITAVHRFCTLNYQ